MIKLSRQILSVFIFLTLFPGNPTFAQVTPPGEKLNWWEDLDGFYNQQAKHSLLLVQEILTGHPPEVKEPKERQMALLMLDNVLHEAKAPNRPAVQAFFHTRIKSAIAQIAQTKVRKGATIWKLYNHGFVVRTKSVTIGFDLVRAHSAKVPEFALPDADMAQLVKQCDLLFISHLHRDHADDWVAQQFIAQGKPVVTPPGVWEKEPFYEKVQHLERTADKTHTLPLATGKAINVIVYPGHQGKTILNNVSIITTPEGITFGQTGDQSNLEDFAWIDKIGGKQEVDVILPNCWTTDLPRLVKGINPKLVITGHENEMGHTVDHREPYWLTYVRMQLSDYPKVLMTWGEQYHYKP